MSVSFFFPFTIDNRNSLSTCFHFISFKHIYSNMPGKTNNSFSLKLLKDYMKKIDRCLVLLFLGF
jgi:choline kinase